MLRGMTDQRRPDDDEQDDISLARLTEAFAEVLGKADPSMAELLGAGTESATRDEGAEILRFAPNDTEATQHDSDSTRDAVGRRPDAPPHSEPPPTPLSILEAMLFVGHPRNVPLTAPQ